MEKNKHSFSTNKEEFEKKIYDFWITKNFFSANLKSEKKSFGLLIPPPNLTGELHLGHALQHSILDVIARYKRLLGFEVLLLPGVDHAGIQFEGTFDKVLAKKDLSKRNLNREEWLKMAFEYKADVYKSVSKSWRLMGISADWSKEVFTLDPAAQKAVYFQFKSFYDKGFIYKGPYIVQWCPKCNTAIEDVEIEYETRREKLYFLKYGPLTLATSRPETKFGDTAMAVNPKDKRYKEVVGKSFEIDTLNGKKMMSVVADNAVDMDFGTGVIKVTPAHDFADYEIGKRHGLPIVQVINKDGRLTDAAGKYSGLKVLEAREAMIGELKEKGILVKEEEYVHNVAVCERCRSIVEPLISEEWFVKVGHLANGAIDSIKKNEVNFLPTSFRKVIVDWLENMHDWCISRSLWWGHRIPVWYKDGEIKVSDVSPGDGWSQDEQVLDTWFSSGLWPLITLGWPEEGQELKTSEKSQSLFDKYYPWDFEISAPEIKFLWIARMIMLGVYFTGKAPFKKMFFHGTLRDLEGRKFSKSLGNGIDPVYLIEKWGVDATRMALYTYSVPGRDGKVSKQIFDERCKNFRNFATKLRNVTHFVIDLAPEDSSKELSFKHPDDLKIRNDLEFLVTSIKNHMETLSLHLAVDDLYNFVWHRFADEYLEKTKSRRAEAQPVLEHILKSLLILLHPFMPFVTEEQYLRFKKARESIMLESFPE